MCTGCIGSLAFHINPNTWKDHHFDEDSSRSIWLQQQWMGGDVISSINHVYCRKLALGITNETWEYQIITAELEAYFRLCAFIPHSKVLSLSAPLMDI